MKRALNDPPDKVPKSTSAKHTHAPAPTSGTSATSLSTSTRLMGEWKAAQKRQAGQPDDADPHSHLSLGLVEEGDFTLWYCRKYYPDNPNESTQYKRIRQGLVELGKDYLEWHLRFSDQYPFIPPRVWMHHPHLDGANVWGSGGICAQVISENNGGGWTPLMNVQVLMKSISNTTEQYRNVKVRQGTYPPHTEKGAMSDWGRIEHAHRDGWGDVKATK